MPRTSRVRIPSCSKRSLRVFGDVQEKSWRRCVGMMSAAEAMPLAKATAEKAIELDDTSAEGHTSLAELRSYEFGWVGGEHEFRRALSPNPNYALAHHQFGIALAQQGAVQDQVLVQLNQYSR